MFNLEEIKDLMSALDSWESDDGGELLSTLMGGMLTPKEKQEEYLEERKIKAEETTQAKEARKERSILLKAKLISMRDAVEAKEFGESIV